MLAAGEMMMGSAFVLVRGNLVRVTGEVTACLGRDRHWHVRLRRVRGRTRPQQQDERQGAEQVYPPMHLRAPLASRRHFANCRAGQFSFSQMEMRIIFLVAGGARGPSKRGVVPMNWILVAFVFNLAPNGDFEAPKMLYRAFPTEQACNLAGEHFREEFILPQSTKSASLCLDRAAFGAKDWQVLESPVSEVPPQPGAADAQGPSGFGGAQI